MRRGLWDGGNCQIIRSILTVARGTRTPGAKNKMSEAKAEMYGSYLAMFSFASAMVLLQLFFDSKVGMVLWGLIAWQTYRRHKPVLVITLKLLFWLIIVGGIGGVIWLIFDPRNEDLAQFMNTERLGLAISAGMFWWMRTFFEQSPTAADIFSTSMAEKQASAGAAIATVDGPAPEPQAGNTPANVVASPPPAPPAESIRTRVLAGAKQVMFWRKIRAQPAFAGDPPATAGNVANTARVDNNPAMPAKLDKLPEAAVEPAKAAQTAVWVAPIIADIVPPPLAAPIPVATPPEIKAVPVYVSKTAAPEIPSTIPPPLVIEDDVVDRIYAKIAKELETDSMTKGLWTRLYAECDGDETRTKVLYIRQRAEKLIAAERMRRLK